MKFFEKLFGKKPEPEVVARLSIVVKEGKGGKWRWAAYDRIGGKCVALSPVNGYPAASPAIHAAEELFENKYRLNVKVNPNGN